MPFMGVSWVGTYIEDAPDEEVLMGRQGYAGHCVDGSVFDSDGLAGGCLLGRGGLRLGRARWDTCRHFPGDGCCCWESKHFGRQIGHEAMRHGFQWNQKTL